MRCRRILLALILVWQITSSRAAPLSLVPLSNAESSVAIVLVGGLGKNYHFFNHWQGWLKDSGASVYGFDSDFTFVSLQNSSWHLAVGMSDLAYKNKTTLIILAHSLGGLVAKHALYRMDRQNILSEFKRVELHAMGSPWGGSFFANILPYLPFNTQVLDLIGYPMVMDIGSESEFMKALDAPLPSNVHFYLYEGTRDTVAQAKTNLTDARYRSNIAGASSRALLYGGRHHDFSLPFIMYFEY